MVNSFPSSEHGKSTVEELQIVQDAILRRVSGRGSSTLLPVGGEFLSTSSDDSSPLHTRLDEGRLDINYNTRVRVAGCHPDGTPLDEEGIKRDVNIIHLLHGRQVMTPAAIYDQMAKLRAAIKSVGDDPLQLDAKDYPFLTLGGHTPSKLFPDVLSEVVRGESHMYGLIVEWVESNFCLPLAYNFGFTETPDPDDDSRFPNFDPDDIAGPGKEFISKYADQIMVSWRVGTLRELTRNIRKKMMDIGIDVPRDLIGIMFRRMGFNNLIKAVCSEAACLLGLKGMTYNTAKLCLPGGEHITPNQCLLNEPLRGSNQALFENAGIRSRQDIIETDDGREVARVVWDVFYNYPASVRNAVFRKGGVLDGKGGFDKGKVLRYGSTLATVTRERNRV